jgi:LCP family protein required for cell wall assembly
VTRLAAARLCTLAVAVVVALAVVAAGAGAVVAYRGVVRPSYDRDGLVTFLVLGSDIGPPQRPGNPLHGRADAIHLVAVDPRGKRATIVDIPRDSLIGGIKANDHLVRGGPPAIEGALEAYTGLAIDFWALTTFAGLESLVDGMGGIDVVVDQPMRDAFSGSNFVPGPQRLSGAQALAFARDRYSVRGGDLGRSRHQGDLLRFAHIQLRTHLGDAASLARLTALFARNTVTNVPPSELLLLALLATEIDPANVRQVALGGTPGFAGRAAVIHLDARDTFERIRAGQVGP